MALTFNDPHPPIANAMGPSLSPLARGEGPSYLSRSGEVASGEAASG
jgi:hypothetical protein